MLSSIAVQMIDHTRETYRPLSDMEGFTSQHLTTRNNLDEETPIIRQAFVMYAERTASILVSKIIQTLVS